MPPRNGFWRPVPDTVELLLQRDVEIRMAIGGGIVRDGFRQIAALDRVLQGRLLDFVGQSFDVRFAVAVSADLQVRIPLAHESEVHFNVNVRVIDRLLGSIDHDEVSTTRPDAGTNAGHVRRASGQRRGSHHAEEDDDWHPNRQTFAADARAGMPNVWGSLTRFHGRPPVCNK